MDGLMSKLSLRQVDQKLKPSALAHKGLQDALSVVEYLNSSPGNAIRGAIAQHAAEKTNTLKRLIEHFHALILRHSREAALRRLFRQARRAKKRRHDLQMEEEAFLIEYLSKQALPKRSNTDNSFTQLYFRENLNPIELELLEKKRDLKSIEQEILKIGVQLEDITTTYIACYSYLKSFYAACPSILEPTRDKELLTKATKELMTKATEDFSKLLHTTPTELYTKYNTLVNALQLTMNYFCKPNSHVLCDENGKRVSLLEDAVYILQPDMHICCDNGKTYLLTRSDTPLHALNLNEQEEAYQRYLSLKPTLMTPKRVLLEQEQQEKADLALKKDILLQQQRQLKQEIATLKNRPLKPTQILEPTQNDSKNSYSNILHKLNMQPRPQVQATSEAKLEEKPMTAKKVSSQPAAVQPEFNPVPVNSSQLGFRFWGGPPRSGISYPENHFTPRSRLF